MSTPEFKSVRIGDVTNDMYWLSNGSMSWSKVADAHPMDAWHDIDRHVWVRVGELSSAQEAVVEFLIDGFNKTGQYDGGIYDGMNLTASYEEIAVKVIDVYEQAKAGS